MLLKAFHTFVSKIVMAAASFGLVVLTSRLLGPEGRGEISLITMAMALVVLANDFLAGSSLVYFTPRKKLPGLLLPAYAWSLLLCLLAVPILHYTGFIPLRFIWPLSLATFFFCLLSANYSVMLGKKNINERNMLQVLLPILQLLLFWSFYSGIDGVGQYVNMLNTSIGICLFFSFIILFRFVSLEKPEALYYPEHIRYGIPSQTGNLVIFLAYRINFKVVDHFHGEDELGVYSTAVMLGEALLLITQSIVTVQQAHLVNSEDDTYRQNLTNRNFAVASLALGSAAFVLALLPPSFYLLVFGAGFAEIRAILLLFLPGVLFLGLSSVLSHYYAGVARFKTMLVANLFCLSMVTASGFLLVPVYGAQGAAAAQTIGYLCVLLFYLNLYLKEKNIRFSKLLPGKELFMQLKTALKKD